MNIEVPDRVIVVGSGSIAARHVRNLLALGVSEVAVVTRRDLSSVPAFQDERIAVAGDLPADCPKIAIVANDTDRHVMTALELLGRGVHLLIEKPLASAVGDDTRRLIAEAEQSGLIVRVAYNLRFLPVWREIARHLEERTIGTPVYVRVEAGQHLAAWRPARPYAESYSASVERGGGVALDLSHELDYVRMLFGHPRVCCARRWRSGTLLIDTEDIFEGIYGLPGGALCSVHLDYIEPTVRRRMRIVSTDGVIDCDIAGRRLSIETATGMETLDDDALFDTTRTYIDEIISFLSEVAGRELPEVRLPSLADGQAVLEMIGNASAAETRSPGVHERPAGSTG